VNCVHAMHAGDKALAESLTVVLRSRDPAKLRSEVAPNKKVLSCTSPYRCLHYRINMHQTLSGQTGNRTFIHFTYSLTGYDMTGEDCY
jgi:hypothetical protein